MTKIVSEIVEVCVFRRSKPGLRYLLLQRSSEEDLYPHIWQIVTGYHIEGESSERAALREVKEETGCSAKRFWTVPFIDSYFDRSKDAVQCVPVFAVELEATHTIHLSHEHQKYAWVPFSIAQKRLVWPGQRQALGIVHKFIAAKKEASTLLEIKNYS